MDVCIILLSPLRTIVRCVLMKTVALDKVPYVDFPELKFNAHESTQMPFRYVTDKEGSPIMPQVRNAILCHDREDEKTDFICIGNEGADTKGCG